MTFYVLLLLFSASQKVTRRVPKGTSDYQAFWILDDEDDKVM